MPAPQSTFFSRTLEFVQVLRSAGIAVDPGRSIDFCRALTHIQLSNIDDVRAAARTTLIARREDRTAFDETFHEFWFGTRLKRTTGATASQAPETTKNAHRYLSRYAERADTDAQATRAPSYSAAEVLRKKELALIEEHELEQARRIIQELAALFSQVDSRRYVTSRWGQRFEFRRMFRRAAITGGSDLRLFYRHRDKRKLRLLLLVDVSGSMERYARFIIEFVDALQQYRCRSDVAVFATRMTVVTDLLHRDDISKSVQEIGQRARDWGGGTNIGACLRAFNRRYIGTLLRSDTVVVILSDGWDRGDPQLMREQIAQLARHAHRLIWLNPLLGDRDYEPLTRGMRDALPFVDVFLPLHNLEALDGFARTLRRLWQSRTRA